MSDKSEIQLSTETPPEGDQGQQPATETTYGGYKTVEELVAAHEALKTAQATPPEGNQGDEGGSEGDQKVTKEIPDGDGDGAQAAVEGAGLDWNALNTEYAENGVLSDETYASLEKAGIPRDAVDTYIRGRQSEADAYDNKVFEAAGGVDEYKALIEWAKNSLTQDEKVAFNEAVSSGNAAKAALAVEALTHRRSKTRGTPPANLLNGRGGASGVQPYKSRAEMATDMRNPKYRNDPAFRDTVLARLRESSFN